MVTWICPLCGQPLEKEKAGLHCPAGHSYDFARSGYVNLLRGAGVHGDDKIMVQGRHAFLEAGYYRPLEMALCDTLRDLPHDVILDAGCGECRYTAAFREALGEKPLIFGVDLSKDALILGGKRRADLQLAVASVYHMPLPSHCADVIVSVFAPLASREFARILRPGGTLVRVVPLPRHLWQLKEAVYAHPYLNAKEDATDGFTVVSRRRVEDRITLSSGEMIRHLFSMTPYYYKTAPSDAAKLNGLETLTTEIAFEILCYAPAGESGTL